MLFCLAAAVLLPYLAIPVIPGTDYANHLARLYVLGAAPGSALRASFSPHWALMPDLGIDIAYMTLKPVATPETVLRLCLTGALAIDLACVWWIQAVLFRQISAAAALAPLCVAGLPVVMGNINFVIGTAFVMLGACLLLARAGPLSLARIAALAAVAGAAWLTHFASYATLMAFTAASLLGTWWVSGRRIASLASAGAATLAIASPGMILSALAEQGDPARQIGYSLLKLRCLLAPVMATGTPSDFLLWLGVACIAILCRGFGTWQVALPARAGLAALAGLMIVLPCRIGYAYDVDSRLAVPIMLLLLACSRILPPFGAWGGRATLAAIGLLIAGRDTWLVEQARAQAAQLAAFRTADQVLPMAAPLMVAIDDHRLADCSKAGSAFSHVGAASNMAAYATIDRGAWEPFIFARPGMQPIRSAVRGFPPVPADVVPPSLDSLKPGAPTPAPEDHPVPVGWPEHFDALLVVGQGCRENPMPGLLQPASNGPGFAFFRLVHPAPG